MARLTWDNTSERYFETGISHVVLYVMNDDGTYRTGVAWNGLTGIDEKYSGYDPIHVYSDSVPYNKIHELGIFEATLKAYAYPNEFLECEGIQSIADGVYINLQEPKTFGLCYRTTYGNDTDGIDHGYKIHLLYDCIAIPSERTYNSIKNDPELTEYSWDISTTLVSFGEYLTTAALTIDSTKLTKGSLIKLENYLYGSSTNDSILLDPNDVVKLLNSHYLVTEEQIPIVFGNSRIVV